mgnify:CR=1 FL=1
MIEEIKRPINIALNDSLKNSSNLSAETLFKVAGGHFVKNTGAIKNSILMFNEYCKKNNIIFECTKIKSYSQNNFENEAREKRYKFYEEILNLQFPQHQFLL